MSRMHVYEVVIIGGGPAGCATALSVFRNAPKASCLVIDDADPSSFKIGESLPPESGRLLHYLHPSLASDISERLNKGIYTTCTGNASAWSSPILEERHAIMNPFGHGIHLNRSDFDELLRCAVRKASSESTSLLELERGTFKGIQKGADGLWNIEVDGKGERKVVTTKWVIDATGRKASVTTKLNNRIGSQTPLLAFYAVFVAGDGDEDTTYCDRDMRTLIEATPDGWWYSSLISHKPSTRVVVFHTLPSHSAAKSSRRSDGFLDQLQASSTHISEIISKWDYHIQRGYPCCTAAGSSHLDKAFDVSERWAAVGDAAMAFDPLSSQGIMTALEMGTYLGLQISQHLKHETADVDLDRRMGETYTKVQADYEKNRAYYYSVVKRFTGEKFWENVIGGRVN